MRSAGFEPTIPASERLQILALERVATGVIRQDTQLAIYTYVFWEKKTQRPCFADYLIMTHQVTKLPRM